MLGVSGALLLVTSTVAGSIDPAKQASFKYYPAGNILIQIRNTVGSSFDNEAEPYGSAKLQLEENPLEDQALMQELEKVDGIEKITAFDSVYMTVTFSGGSGSFTSISDFFPTLNREQTEEKQAVLSSGTADYDDMVEKNGILVEEDIAQVGDTLKIAGRAFDGRTFDVEAVVVPDALLASEGWREQVKAVIHVRVTGAQAPWRVGMILEGFDQQYVESISDYKTLDSWQNPHGELPNWTVGTLQENSLHYESNPLRPCIEIGGLQRLNDANRGAGTEEYTRIDDKGTTHKTVFNPRVNKYWTSPKTEQYDAALADITTPATLAYIQSQTFYNAIPGYVNVDGGLYTYTVIYHMKPRAEMSAEESTKALKNMIDAVNVTTNQNFYIVNNDFSPVGLKGYQPVDFAVKEKPNGYKPRYDQVFAANTDKLDATIPYYSKGGQVWGFKSPTLTKHVWNKMYFSDAYPYYESWVDSNGSQNPDWNTKEVNNLYLTCWW